MPSEAEVEVAVLWMKKNKDGVNTNIRAEHIQGWLRKAYPVRESIPPNLN